MTRNEARLKKQIRKQFQFTSPEDPGFSEEAALKYKTVEMPQLVGQAQARGLLNEQEAADLSKIDPQKRRDVLAQATVESVTAFQLGLRRQRRDEHAAEEEKKKQAAAADEVQAPFTPNPEVKIDQLIYLQDFPQTADDMRALVKRGFQQLNGVYLVEELFNREIEDETDGAQTPKAELGAAEQAEGEQPEEAKGPPEKLFNKLQERAVAFNDVVEINRVLKRQPQGSALRHCDVQRLKFAGPADPMDLPTPPEDGSEPPAVDEERKAAEFKLYDEFASTQKETIDELAGDLANFKTQQAEATTLAAPLWPVQRSEEEEARLRALEDLRASQQEALRQKQEEERAAAAAAAAAAKGGKKSAQKTTRAAAEKEKEAAAEAAGDATAEEAPPVEELPPQYTSTDDDPARRGDFFEFQKIMSEMETGTATVGSIMAAMVYQVGRNNDQIQKDALSDKYYQEASKEGRRRLSLADKRETSRQLTKANAEDRVMGDVFDQLMEKLQIEHSILETDFRHVFNEDCVLNDPEQKSSPYMEVKSENDRINTGKGAYLLPDGKTQGETEQATLETCLIPGVNKRLGMPKTAAQSQALRESDQDQIIQFCKLPTSQTKRCLVLRAAENMMQAQQPERTFSFLDRNYVEEYKDSNTMRQVLSTAMSQLQPDLETKYFEKDDGLLVSMFFKNPPGRLMRTQWTHPVRVFPDFPDWRGMVKEQTAKLEEDRLLDISNDKVGVLRINTKFSFPSDNSVIRVDKYNMGQRRMGETKIIKDDFTFGVRERKDIFDQKVQNEDCLRNRDAKEKQDRNCDFWLLFENGVRLNIEMQEHQGPNMDLVPRADIPAWLKAKLAREKQKQKELEEQSESQVRKSQLAAEEGQHIDGAASVVGSVMDSERKESGRARAPTDGTKESFPNEASVAAADAQDEKPSAQAEAEPAQKEEEEIIEEDDPELKNPSIEIDGHDMTVGSKLTFTFEQGLVVQIQPNGDVMQQFVQNKPLAKSTVKGNNLVQDQLPDNLIEQYRIITTNGEIIKQMGDGNFLVYFSDGALTYSDKRKGIWYTINPVGVKRVRREKDGIVTDEVQRLKIETKIDPETSATLKIREDGVLTVEYVDSTHLIIMPDGTNILRKKRAGGEAGTVTFITKDGFVPIRQTYDPVKARAKTIIGLGGTDALMGKDLIMERTNNGKITEVLLPDNTVVQSYLEKQELEGYNNFSLNMIHIIRRADYSVVKVCQDGEVVLITANERAYLNDIGKQIEELGTKDYDYFFELFGISSERRSGVYTANLNKGRVWTQDEEGNYFIAYANGDSVEKMSVSFDLDQMVEGIENKEPSSPRMKDGNYIEEECKFLPPPKSMAHPRLFYVRNDGSGMELFNEEQLGHMFRTNRINNQEGFIKRSNNVKIQNEDCISHVFITKKEKQFNASGFDVSSEFPKLPQSLDLVNQTVSIPTEPVVEPITYKAVLEFKAMDEQMLAEFNAACSAYDDLKAGQAKLQEDLTMQEPVVITTAAPPTEKRERMRSSDMKSTFMGSDSDKASPRGLGSDRGGSDAGSTSRRKQAHGSKSNFELQRASVQEAEKGSDSTKADDDLLIDETTGMQIVQHDLGLNHQQRLQLRIAKERGINIDNLMSAEYEVLKQYKSLEKRQQVFNNMHDFMDRDDEAVAPRHAQQ